MARRGRAGIHAAVVALAAVLAALAAAPGAAQQTAPAAAETRGIRVAQAGARDNAPAAGARDDAPDAGVRDHAPDAGARDSRSSGLSDDAQAAVATVERLHTALVGAAQSNEGAPLDERIAAIRPVIVATHDLPHIAELTIRREWASLSDAERTRFVEAFSGLSVTTYASRFRGLREGMFELGEPAEAAGGRQSVTATLVTAEREIPFEYVLHDTGEGWKIINILADNVSDLALKRAEYRRVLGGGTIDDLIAEIERQTRDLRSAD